MLAEHAAASDIVTSTFAEASNAIGIDLWDIAQNGPEDELNRTAVTQPTLLAASVVLWRLWQDADGATPTLLSGHSLGEYSALVCSGALAFAEAVKLVHTRGNLMQAAVPEGEGAMAAILGLEDEQVAGCCVQASADGGIVAPANYNSPGQLVVAGSTDAVDRLVALATEAGARRALKLAVSVPSHSALMTGAATQLREHLDSLELSAPQIPIVQNVDALVAPDLDGIRSRLQEQLHQPVRWSMCVEAMAAAGVDTLVECGPGKVIAGLAKRIDRSLTAFGLNTPADLAKAIAGTSA